MLKKQRTQIPRRVLIDRATGLPVGPEVSIAPVDWPFSMPPPGEILWRYMDERKFVDILKSGALYFARGDRFKEPFEERLSPGNQFVVSESDKSWQQAYGWGRDPIKSAKYHEIHRLCVFISCWNRGFRESARMWKEYTESPDSVAIVTSVRSLTRFLPEAMMKAAVMYHEENFPRTELGHNTLFFCKPKSCSFEREFRLLRNLDKNETVKSDDPKDFGRHVAIRIKKVIHRVITHPRASFVFKKRIDALISEHLPSRRREDSSLCT